MNDVTRLLQRFREGDRDVMDELVPLLYPELRRIAGSFMHRQPPGHTLQPTALVNEAFIKLFGGAQPQFNDRAHFLALTSRVMRQVLVDHARRAAAEKRGGHEGQVPWDTKIDVRGDAGDRQIELLHLHRALEALERESPPLGGARGNVLLRRDDGGGDGACPRSLRARGSPRPAPGPCVAAPGARRRAALIVEEVPSRTGRFQLTRIQVIHSARRPDRRAVRSCLGLRRRAKVRRSASYRLTCNSGRSGA